MTGDGHGSHGAPEGTPIEDVTPGDLAMLDQNWSAINAGLDDLVDLYTAHRATDHGEAGCVWYCNSLPFVRAVKAHAATPPALEQLLHMAIHRLVTGERPRHARPAGDGSAPGHRGHGAGG
jgi:hypothetical protein